MDYPIQRHLHIPSGNVLLHGELTIPFGATGIVIFAHGSGSSRFSPRNKFVAETISNAGIGTLLFDLLTRQEESIDEVTRKFRFNISLLASRLMDVTLWISHDSDTAHLCPGYFGASTGGAAALVAAAGLGEMIGAVVSRGGRPDLAGEALIHVASPTLLIVGQNDPEVIRLNQEAYRMLACEKEMKIIPRATHLFEEPGTLQQVARLATGWFERHMGKFQDSKYREQDLFASI